MRKSAGMGWFNESRRHALASKGIKTGMKTRWIPQVPKKNVPLSERTGLENAKNVTIIARRWFDKINGNTYHSTEVYVDGKLVGTEPFAYGYDKAYLQTAHDILVKAGYYPYEKTTENVDKFDKEGKYQYSTPKESINKENSYWRFNTDMRENRKKFVISVSDVGRKRDL